eukprot:230820_1
MPIHHARAFKHQSHSYHLPSHFVVAPPVQAQSTSTKLRSIPRRSTAPVPQEEPVSSPVPARVSPPPADRRFWPTLGSSASAPAGGPSSSRWSNSSSLRSNLAPPPPRSPNTGCNGSKPLSQGAKRRARKKALSDQNIQPGRGKQAPMVNRNKSRPKQSNAAANGRMSAPSAASKSKKARRKKRHGSAPKSECTAPVLRTCPMLSPNDLAKRLRDAIDFTQTKNSSLRMEYKMKLRNQESDFRERIRLAEGTGVLPGNEFSWRAHSSDSQHAHALNELKLKRVRSLEFQRALTKRILCSRCSRCKIEHAFVPCGHVVCAGCSRVSSKRCPFCGKGFSRVQEVFL